MQMHHRQFGYTSGKQIALWLLTALRYTKHPEKVRSIPPRLTAGLCLCLLAFIFIPYRVGAAESAGKSYNQKSSSSARQVATNPLSIDSQPVAMPHPKKADFEGEPKSRAAQQVADWAVDSGDNHGMPFAIVDKKEAKIFVFHADGRLRGAAPVLLGLAKGDDSIPGIGDKKMSQIRPSERTTPAGRFVAYLGYESSGKEVFWVDYEGAVSMHRVVTSNPKERRLQRLASPSPLERRISFGCINLPVKFYNDILTPAFTGTYGIVYVLPEIKSIKEVFDPNHDFESNGKQAQLQR